MTARRQAIIIVAALLAFALGLPFSGAVPTASAQTISVTAADPPTGEQGTLNLNVRIKGKGFKNGALVKFYKAGSENASFINVKSTQFVSSTELLATIDIADVEAALGGFDIEVAVAGRTGKGTELFSVVAKQTGNVTLPPAIQVGVWVDNSVGNNIRPEGDPGLPYDGIYATLSPSLRDGTTDTYDYYFTFWRRYSTDALEANRSVVFDFGTPRYVPGDKLQCYPTEDFAKDRAKVPYLFTVPTFLTTGIMQGSDEPPWVTIQTSYEWVKVGDTWQRTAHYLDLRPYVTGQPQPPDTAPHYVELIVLLRTVELIDRDAYAFIAHNGPVTTPAWSTRGLAEVTPAAGGGFVLKPLPAEALSASLATAWLYPWLGLKYEDLSGMPNQANLTIQVPLGGKNGFRAVIGMCSVGTFEMPFAMTVK